VDSVTEERDRLADLMWNASLLPVLHAVVKLGVADLLGDGPASAEQLAERSGTHAGSLYRLLRVAVTAGVVTLDGELFALTARGQFLRTGVPGSMRNPILWQGSDEQWLVWRDLAYSVRTGMNAFPRAFGCGLYEHLSMHPDKEAIFNEAMAANSRAVADVLPRVPGVAEHARVIDVGGGSGVILAGLLAANPRMHGVLFDTHSGLRDAEATLSAAGLRDRCEIVAGDFFVSVPSGCDAYLLKHVIHNWSDEQAVTILRHCREAMVSDSVIYLVDAVVPADPAEFNSVTLVRDLNMLISLNGRQRTEAEFAQLLAAADLKLDAASALPPPSHLLSLITASPA
jgi:hypothetical protein